MGKETRHTNHEYNENYVILVYYRNYKSCITPTDITCSMKSSRLNETIGRFNVQTFSRPVHKNTADGFFSWSLSLNKLLPNAKYINLPSLEPDISNRYIWTSKKMQQILDVRPIGAANQRFPKQNYLGQQSSLSYRRQRSTMSDRVKKD